MPPRRAEGARLLLSAREVVEDSTAESGFVGFLSAAVEGVGKWKVHDARDMEGKGRDGNGRGCGFGGLHTFEVAAALGLEFFPPAPDGVED